MLLRHELEKGSLDAYATMRSIYRQQRADEINGGRASGGGLVERRCAGGGPLGRCPTRRSAGDKGEFTLARESVCENPSRLWVARG